MLRLSALGGYALLRDGVLVDGLSDRRLAFLSVLACAAPDRGVSRDRLLLLFWPEKNEEQGKNALKQLTFALRRDLAARRI
jgi:DNA-binding SARP family transcriptional activator